MSAATIVDIEDLHQAAVQEGKSSYFDPATGFTVFTETVHLKRGKCCGNQCRHCPYGWDNVPNPNIRRTPKVKSGDVEATQALLLTSLTPNKRTGGRLGGAGTDKNVPYTRKGDKGTSRLANGEERSKTDAAFEAMGTVDEICSHVGLVHAQLLEQGSENYEPLPDYLLNAMSRLFDIGSHLAKPRKVDDDDSGDEDVQQPPAFDPEHVNDLESWIDEFTEELPELTSFILPTGSTTAAHLHVARTVCRRAERRLLAVSVVDPNTTKYLNRLSDFLFIAARFVNFKKNKPDMMYRLPYRGATQRNRVQGPVTTASNGSKS